MGRTKGVVRNWEELPLMLDLLTVAMIFDVRHETVRRWLYEGKIKGFKIGAKWYFTKDYIQQLSENESA